VAREAEVYRLAAGDARMRPLRDLLPAFHRYDAEKGILITGFVPDADNLTWLHERLRAFPIDIAQRTGAALAGLHSIDFPPGTPRPDCFGQRPHWILLLHRGGDLEHLRRTPAASQVIDVLLKAPGLGDHLGQLHDSWSTDRLIHADMRWENCLLAPRTQPIEARRLYVIDWELADIGDAAWDVGGILQAYLNSWIVSMQAGAADEDALAASARRPLDAIQPAIAAFWRAYASNAPFLAAPDAFLVRSVKMMAARMMVTAFEISVSSVELDARVMIMLQAALNVFERAAPAVRELLGIDTADASPDGAMPARRSQFETAP
jgi:Phosphotransferase enzyme family